MIGLGMKEVLVHFPQCFSTVSRVMSGEEGRAEADTRLAMG